MYIIYDTRRPFFIGTNGPILNVQNTLILGHVPIGKGLLFIERSLVTKTLVCMTIFQKWNKELPRKTKQTNKQTKKNKTKNK